MNDKALIAWDVEQTVAPFASAIYTITGSSTIVRDFGSYVDTEALSFSFSNTMTRGPYPWTEAGAGFEDYSEDEFWVMRWSMGAFGTRNQFDSVSPPVPLFTRVLNLNYSGFNGAGATQAFAVPVTGTATRTVDRVYNPDDFPPDETPPPEHYEFEHNYSGNAGLNRAVGDETAYFTLQMQGYMPGTVDNELDIPLDSGDVDFMTLDGLLALGGTETFENNTPPDASYTTYANSYTMTLALS